MISVNPMMLSRILLIIPLVGLISGCLFGGKNKAIDYKLHTLNEAISLELQARPVEMLFTYSLSSEKIAAQKDSIQSLNTRKSNLGAYPFVAATSEIDVVSRSFEPGTQGVIRILETKEGMFKMWAGAAHVPGAKAFRLLLKVVSTEPDTKAAVLNGANDTLNPIAINGDKSWSPTIPGNTMNVAVWWPAESDGPIGIQVQSILPIWHSLGELSANSIASEVLDASCFSSHPRTKLSLDKVKRSVGLVSSIFGSPPFGNIFGFCSGNLIANDKKNGRALFLTANHCLVDDGYKRAATDADIAGSFGVIFDYATSACNQNHKPYSYSELSSLPQVSGAKVLASSWKNDFALLELSGLPDSNRHFLEFENSPDFQGGIGHLDRFRISHPHAYPQSYSGEFWQHLPEVAALDYGAPYHCIDRIPSTHFTYASWKSGRSGRIFPGSSGSVALDTRMKGVGQLWGYCIGSLSSGGKPGRGTPLSYSVDGKFGVTHSAIREILAQ